MGLDCFWQLPEEAEPPEFEKQLKLTGGMLSGHGKSSFRGKVYRAFVKLVSGKSLDRGLTSEEVKEVAEDLENQEWNPVFKGGYHGFRDKEEFLDFRTMFVKYAEKDAALAAWG